MDTYEFYVFQFTLLRKERQEIGMDTYEFYVFQFTLLRKEQPYYTVIMQTNCIYIVIFLLPFPNIHTLLIQKIL